MRNKYGNRQIEYNGEKYDSVKEYRRHDELKLLERAGKITGLQRQVKFELVPKQCEESTEVFKRGKNKGLPKPGKMIEPAVSYWADFTYWQDGKYVVEDVKSPATKTPLYLLKRRLMLYFHGIRIKEV